MDLRKLQPGTPLVSTDQLIDAMKTTVRDAEFGDRLIPQDDQNIVNVVGGVIELPADAPLGYSAVLVSQAAGQTLLSPESGGSLPAGADNALLGLGSTAVVLVTGQNAQKTAAQYAVGGNGTAPYNDTTPWAGQNTGFPVGNHYYYDVPWFESLGLFVMVGTTGTAGLIVTSPDGETWTSQTVPAGVTAVQSVTFDGTKLVATCDKASGCHVLTSIDAITWVDEDTGLSVDGFTFIQWSERLQRFHASNIDSFFYSPNGVTGWTEIPWVGDHSLSYWECIVDLPELGILAACGDGGSGQDLIYSDDDGATWTLVPTPVNDGYYRIVWSPELRTALAVNDYGNPPNTGKGLISTDGKTWRQTVEATALTSGTGVWAKELGLFILPSFGEAGFGDSDRAYISVDGDHYSEVSLPSAEFWSGIGWSGSLGIAVIADYTFGSNTFHAATSNPL